MMTDTSAIDTRLLDGLAEDLGPEVLSSILERSRAHATTMLDAFRSAVGEGRDRDVGRAAHQLTGLCAQLGFTRATTLTRAWSGVPAADRGTALDALTRALDDGFAAALARIDDLTRAREASAA